MKCENYSKIIYLISNIKITRNHTTLYQRGKTEREEERGGEKEIEQKGENEKGKEGRNEGSNEGKEENEFQREKSAG